MLVWVQGGHECWVDDYVVAEARRNLAAKYPAALGTFEALLAQLRVAPLRAPEPSTQTDWLDEKDRPVLAAAIQPGCNALVTGDRTHFGGAYAKVFEGVTIHWPRSLAEALFR